MSLSKIEQLLIKEAFKEFYIMFTKHNGEGYLLNYIAGAKIYDMISKIGPIDIDIDKKKELWRDCKTDFRIKVYKVAEENKKKQLEDILKTKIAEWHLNKMANEGNVYEL